jgi:hypothetical protein
MESKHNSGKYDEWNTNEKMLEGTDKIAHGNFNTQRH